jgi:thiamine biosynthesis lipoprotein
MGSDVHLILVGGEPALLDRAEARIEQLESRWSRFRPDSEVSILTRRAGHLVPVSADTVLLVERAVEAWRLTGGSFDPTVLGAVLRAGYDRSYEDLDDEVAPVRSDLVIGCTDIVVVPDAVQLPAGTGFDPGGIGKGLTADLVAAELLAEGVDGVCINMGGDLRVAGAGPDGAPWTIAIEHPWLREPVTLVGLAGGAVATSTTLKRAWTAGGERRHHLIDPMTGEPSHSDLDLVSVIAGDTWVAEVLAKAALLRGAERAFDIIDHDVQALTVDHDGVLRATPGFTAFTGGRALPATIARPTDEGSPS